SSNPKRCVGEAGCLAHRRHPVATKPAATMLARERRHAMDAFGCAASHGAAWGCGSNWTLADPRAGLMDRPVAVFPAGLLRSEPAAGRFKAAIAPRSGRIPADLGKAGPRPAQRPVKNWPPLVRKPTSLAWQGPDPEAS